MRIKPPIKLHARSTLQDFIKFFQAIPANKWCTDEFLNSKGQSCARGHIKPYTDVDFRLRKLAPNIIGVNNGYKLASRHKGIKTRVIEYLKSLIKVEDKNQPLPLARP